MEDRKLPFDSIYAHGFLRVAVATPRVRISDPGYNVQATLALARQGSSAGAGVVLFPELGLTAYSNEDLFHQDALLDAAEIAVGGVVSATRRLTPALIVGFPARFEGRLFNCAAVIHRGKVLGLVPKSYLPNYREFYEKRQFTSGRDAHFKSVRFLGEEVPFGNDLVFSAGNYPGFAIHVEICEDLWAPIPPSTYAAMAGATIIANLSASNITIGKADYRKHLCAAQSGKCVAAYLYSAAGRGESTTDMGWDGQALIFENDELLAESARFSLEPQLIQADVDLERLRQDRMRLTTFNDCAGEHRARLADVRRVTFEFTPPRAAVALQREVERFPYVPSDPRRLEERCYEAYNIQVTGLAQRLEATGITKLVIGISGGLDSTHALIVAAKACDYLELPRKNILAYTLPGYATSEQTLQNAWRLMKALDVSGEEIDIRPSCDQMLRDIGHPFSRGEKNYDITFENVQAGERASHLFRLANHHGGLVVGTSDLSELALGWATYGVGDHMSHYAVNASVPKTLIQHLIRWVIRTTQFEEDTTETLRAILNTEISPELVPGEDRSGAPVQATEAKIGPFELQDFHLYFVSRYGFRPSKIAYLARHAWGDVTRGPWLDEVPMPARREYDLASIKRWLEVFLHRFFETSQFKRSAMPNAPKVGSGGSLSPRSDWRAPSDGNADVWLRELREGVPDD